jgi:glyoxylase-like metal-dependent hydrolase (beta-lactamase superfamily II)
MTDCLLEPVILGPLAVNCWIYPLNPNPPAGEKAPAETRDCILIDPGADPLLIIARMGALNLYPRRILLTHGHFDHAAALPVLAAKYPDAEIALHRDDGPSLGPGSRRVQLESLAAALGSAASAENLLGFAGDLPPAGKFLAEGDRIGPFTVMHLPGHSPGSIAFYDEAAGLIFSGDTLFRDGVGRTDLPGGDRAKLAASLGRLFSLEGDTAVCPGHGPATTIARERLNFS